MQLKVWQIEKFKEDGEEKQTCDILESKEFGEQGKSLLLAKRDFLGLSLFEQKLQIPDYSQRFGSYFRRQCENSIIKESEEEFELKKKMFHRQYGEIFQRFISEEEIRELINFCIAENKYTVLSEYFHKDEKEFLFIMSQLVCQHISRGNYEKGYTIAIQVGLNKLAGQIALKMSRDNLELNLDPEEEKVRHLRILELLTSTRKMPLYNGPSSSSGTSVEILKEILTNTNKDDLKDILKDLPSLPASNMWIYVEYFHWLTIIKRIARGEEYDERLINIAKQLIRFESIIDERKITSTRLFCSLLYEKDKGYTSFLLKKLKLYHSNESSEKINELNNFIEKINNILPEGEGGTSYDGYPGLCIASGRMIRDTDKTVLCPECQKTSLSRECNQAMCPFCYNPQNHDNNHDNQ